MKRSIMRAAALVLAAGLSAPAGAQERADGPPSPQTQQQPGAEPAWAVSDGEIVGVLEAANQGELDLAQVALEKGSDPRVKEFASQMRQEHGQAKEKLAGLGIRPVGGEMSRRIGDRGRSAVARLKGLEGATFDRAYVENQVSEHASLLRHIDEKLVPNAREGKLATMLQELRPAVEAHLEHARRLKAELGRR